MQYYNNEISQKYFTRNPNQSCENWIISEVAQNSLFFPFCQSKTFGPTDRQKRLYLRPFSKYFNSVS